MIVFTWVSGFDIIYALQDQKFDRDENLKSIPVLIGKRKALTLSTILHLFTALLVILAGINGSQGSIYWIGALIFISLLFYQHLLVKPDDLTKVNLAFFTTNGIASVLFALFTILDLYI